MTIRINSYGSGGKPARKNGKWNTKFPFPQNEFLYPSRLSRILLGPCRWKFSGNYHFDQWLQKSMTLIWQKNKWDVRRGFQLIRSIVANSLKGVKKTLGLGYTDQDGIVSSQVYIMAESHPRIHLKHYIWFIGNWKMKLGLWLPDIQERNTSV